MDPVKAVLGLVSGGGLTAAVAYYANRFGAHITNDDVAHAAPIVALAGAVIAHGGLKGLWHTLSDGEDFTEGYRALKLGKTVGEPTGGSVIFTNTLTLLDGTRMGFPTTAFYDRQGRLAFLHQGAYATERKLARDIARYAR